jgi:general stress protein 26
MLNNTDLQFLQEKIQDLRSALFFSQNTSLLRMATTIVTILKVDDWGQMWFFVPRPMQTLNEFDREFPVRLEFFRKGKRFFLHVSGKAFIVTDPEEINSLVYEDIREQAAGHMVLIKVKMTAAEYFESSIPSRRIGWWREAVIQLQSWLFNTRPGYRPYRLADTSMSMLSSYNGARIPVA